MTTDPYLPIDARYQALCSLGGTVQHKRVVRDHHRWSSFRLRKTLAYDLCAHIELPQAFVMVKAAKRYSLPLSQPPNIICRALENILHT